MNYLLSPHIPVNRKQLLLHNYLLLLGEIWPMKFLQSLSPLQTSLNISPNAESSNMLTTLLTYSSSWRWDFLQFFNVSPQIRGQTRYITLRTLLAIRQRTWLAFTITRAQCWHCSACPSRAPLGPFWQSPTPASHNSACTSLWELYFCPCTTFHLSLSILMQFLLA